MSADRRGGDIPQPEQQPPPASERRGSGLRARMGRRAMIGTAGALVVGFLGVAANRAVRDWDRIAETITGPKAAEPQQVESLDRKSVDVTDKKEAPAIVINDVKDLVKTVIKKTFQNKFASPADQKDLDAHLKTVIRRNPEHDTKVGRGPLYFTGSGKIEGLSPLIEGTAGQHGWPGLDAQYAAVNDLTLKYMEIYAGLPFGVPELSGFVKTGKNSGGGTMDEIEISKLPEAFKTVVDTGFIGDTFSRTYFSGGHWHAEGQRVSDGARVIMVASRGGHFNVRVEDPKLAGKPDIRDIRAGNWPGSYSLFAKTDAEKFRANMSVEGYAGIPAFTSEDALRTIRTVIKKPYQGVVGTTDPISMQGTELQNEFRTLGTRLFVSGAEGLVSDPIPAHLDTPEARDAREKPHYSFQSIDKKLPLLATGPVKPELSIKYKSNTDLHAPVRVELSGQLPLKEIAQVSNLIKQVPAGNQTVGEIPLDRVSTAFKAVVNLDFLQSGSFKAEEPKAGRWRAVGRRASDNALVEMVAAQDGRFAIRVTNEKEYKPGPNEKDPTLRVPRFTAP